MTKFLNCSMFLAIALTASASMAQVDSGRIRSYHRDAIRAQNVGGYDSAAIYHRKILALIDEDPQFPPAERARHMTNLASVLTMDGKPEEALGLLESVAAILNEYPGGDSGQPTVVKLATAKALAFLERYDEAEFLYTEALQRIEAAGVMDTLYGAEAKYGYAYVLWKTGRPAEAVAGYEFALDFFSPLLKPSHPNMRNLQRELSSARAELQDSQGD